MTFINLVKRKVEPQEKAHLNWMGGPSFSLSDPIAALRLAASSAFFGEPMYYHTDAADKRGRKMTRPMHRAHLSDTEIAHLRMSLGAKAIRERQHWDSVFVYSDMQAGHGGLFGTKPDAYRDYIWSKSGHYIDVPKLIAAYRTKVNPNVMVYLVQVAGYADTIVPEYYDRTFILGGWGEGLLRFAAQMSSMYEQGQQEKGN